MRLSQLHGQLVLESLELSEATGAGKDLVKLLTTIAQSGADFILVGGHSISGYTGRPRATKDVDIVSNDAQTIVTAVQKQFPDVEVNETPVVTRLFRSGQEFLDIIKPTGGNAFYQNALNFWEVINYGRVKIKIPDLEMAIASKFAAMTSRYREHAKKFQDIADFIRMVENNPELDLKKLRKLGENAYNSGGAEILKFIREVQTTGTVTDV